MNTYYMDNFEYPTNDWYYWDGHTTGLIGGKTTRDKHMRRVRKRSKVKNRR